MKVGDKVRYKIDAVLLNKGGIYPIVDVGDGIMCYCLENEDGRNVWVKESSIELVQEDKLPQSQTKKLSKPIRSCEHNGSIYKEDTIDGVSIEDMKATRDNINSKLQTHRNLFNKKK